MAGIEEQLRQIAREEAERVAAQKPQVDPRSPWVQMQEVKQVTGIKDSHTIVSEFCKSDNGMPTYPARKGLVKKINRVWRFKNPEFFNYLHDDYWDGVK